MILLLIQSAYYQDKEHIKQAFQMGIDLKIGGRNGEKGKRGDWPKLGSTITIPDVLCVRRSSLLLKISRMSPFEDR